MNSTKMMPAFMVWIVPMVLIMITVTSAYAVVPGDADHKNGLTLSDAIIALKVTAGLSTETGFRPICTQPGPALHAIGRIL